MIFGIGMVIGFVAGVAVTYYLVHKANPTVAQEATDAIVDATKDAANKAVDAAKDKIA